MKYIPVFFIALALISPGAQAYGETAKKTAKEEAPTALERSQAPASCPKKGAEAALALAKTIERNANHVSIMCLEELLKDHEKRLKALEAAKP